MLALLCLALAALLYRRQQDAAAAALERLGTRAFYVLLPALLVVCVGRGMAAAEAARADAGAAICEAGGLVTCVAELAGDRAAAGVWESWTSTALWVLAVL